MQNNAYFNEVMKSPFTLMDSFRKSFYQALHSILLQYTSWLIHCCTMAIRYTSFSVHITVAFPTWCASAFQKCGDKFIPWKYFLHVLI